MTQPYASFLVSGGAFSSTRVELVLVDRQQGDLHHHRLRPGARCGRPSSICGRTSARNIFVRVVDDETGASTAIYIKESPWAHINFERFRFHESRPFFPNELTAVGRHARCRRWIPSVHAGLSGAEAAQAMTVPKGFTVTLAAAEPDVVRPIAFTLDDRGRLWVAEAHTYPLRAPEGKGTRSHPDLRGHERRRHASTAARSSSRT